MLWTVIAGFLYITWTQRIWPEIRVDAAKPTFKVEYNNPEVLSASELQDIIIVIRYFFSRSDIKTFIRLFFIISLHGVLKIF